MDALQQQVTTFNELVLDLLEISRFDAGAAELQCRRFDLVGLARRTLDEAGCGSTAVTGAGLVEITADPRRMQQVIANLVQNAQRYAGGPSRVHVDAVGGRVALMVEDHGPGISANERHEIFSRFHRGSSGTSRGAPSGTGLGLALVREHVALHGGSVCIEDNDGGGARFLVELPQEPR